MTPEDLRRRREALGFSQVELARRFGVTPNTLWRWESGIHRPPAMVDLALDALEREQQAVELKERKDNDDR